MLEWFDSHSAGYWALVWTLFGLLLLASVGALFASLLGDRFRDWSGRLAPRWLFLTLLAVTFFAFRWPAFFFGGEMNPDESQMLAGAITLQHDPIFWRSVDGTTHGPLDDYALLLPRLLGQPINYCTARVVGALLILGAVFLLYRTLALFFPENLARVGCLPAFCFFAFTTHEGFIHYSSEHMPVFLLSLGFYLLAFDLSTPETRRVRSWHWIAAGVALGAAPLAKLQSAPIAAMILAIGSLQDLLLPGITVRDRFHRLGWLAAGVALVPALHLVALLTAGELSEAWNSYVVQNFYYASNRHLTSEEALQGFWHFTSLDPGFSTLTLGATVLLAVAWLGLPKFSRPALRLLVLSVVFLIFAVIAVLTPGRQYTHYLLLMVIPGTLLIGVLFCAWWQLPTRAGGESQVLLLSAFLAAGVWPQMQSRISHPNTFLGTLALEAQRPLDAVSREILRHAKAGESLGQWGWMCRYYVYTGLRQATRESHTANIIQASTGQDRNRVRYLGDLQRSLPPVFIDTVGPGNFTFQNRSYAHESFPELERFIAGHYRLVTEVEGTRIYVRNDRPAQP